MKKDIFLDTDFNSYLHIFHPDTAKELFGLLPKDSKYYKHLFKLLAEWRSISNSHSLPYYNILMTEGWHKGHTNIHFDRNDMQIYTEKYISKLSERIERSGKIPKQIWNALKLEMLTLSRKAKHASNEIEAKTRFPREQLWVEMLNNIDYKMAISGLIRLCYLSIFNSYEHFVLKVIQDSLNDNSIRTNRDFDKKISLCLGKESAKLLWTSDDMQFIRYVRHSLVHNGGFLTSELNKFKTRFYAADRETYRRVEKTKTGSNIPLCNNEIQITTIVNKWLCNELVVCIKHIIFCVSNK